MCVYLNVHQPHLHITTICDHDLSNRRGQEAPEWSTKIKELVEARIKRSTFFISNCQTIPTPSQRVGESVRHRSRRRGDHGVGLGGVWWSRMFSTSMRPCREGRVYGKQESSSVLVIGDGSLRMWPSPRRPRIRENGRSHLQRGLLLYSRCQTGILLRCRSLQR